MAKKLTKKNAVKVMENILRLPKEDVGVVLEAFNDVLDGLRYDDFFGTEGQLDPRGDGRED